MEQTTDQILNAQFTFDEIKTMINKLKSGKAAGIDKIIAELLKNLDDDTVIILVNIFNKIFDSGEFPEEWALGIIVILFKGGERDDLNNYRGITLLSVVGKLLVVPDRVKKEYCRCGPHPLQVISSRARPPLVKGAGHIGPLFPEFRGWPLWFMASIALRGL